MNYAQFLNRSVALSDFYSGRASHFFPWQSIRLMHLSAGRLIILDITPQPRKAVDDGGKEGWGGVGLRIVNGRVAGTNGGDVLETRYNFESAG